MTVLSSVPKVTSILFKGLDNLVLPFTSKVLEGVDVSSLNTAQVDDQDKYYVKSIDGLGPPDQTIAIARTGSGGKFAGQTSEDRELVVLIGLNPDYAAGETPAFLRNQLYTMLSTAYDPKVSVQLVTGIFPIAKVDAYVTKFETALFSKDPVVQLTLSCLNPTFKALSALTYDPSELDLDHPNIYNPGTAATGFQFKVKFTDTMTAGWFIEFAENRSFGMQFDMVFNAGDVLEVSTIPGQRYVHWHKNRGKVQNKIGILSPDSEWIQLHPGANNFVVPFRNKWVWGGNFQFTPEYWGV